MCSRQTKYSAHSHNVPTVRERLFRQQPKARCSVQEAVFLEPRPDHKPISSQGLNDPAPPPSGEQMEEKHNKSCKKGSLCKVFHLGGQNCSYAEGIVYRCVESIIKKQSQLNNEKQISEANQTFLDNLANEEIGILNKEIGISFKHKKHTGSKWEATNIQNVKPIVAPNIKDVVPDDDSPANKTGNNTFVQRKQTECLRLILALLDTRFGGESEIDPTIVKGNADVVLAARDDQFVQALNKIRADAEAGRFSSMKQFKDKVGQALNAYGKRHMLNAFNHSYDSSCQRLKSDLNFLEILHKAKTSNGGYYYLYQRVPAERVLFECCDLDIPCHRGSRENEFEGNEEYREIVANHYEEWKRLRQLEEDAKEAKAILAKAKANSAKHVVVEEAKVKMAKAKGVKQAKANLAKHVVREIQKKSKFLFFLNRELGIYEEAPFQFACTKVAQRWRDMFDKEKKGGDPFLVTKKNKNKNKKRKSDCISSSPRQCLSSSIARTGEERNTLMPQHDAESDIAVRASNPEYHNGPSSVEPLSIESSYASSLDPMDAEQLCRWIGPLSAEEEGSPCPPKKCKSSHVETCQYTMKPQPECTPQAPAQAHTNIPTDSNPETDLPGSLNWSIPLPQERLQTECLELLNQIQKSGHGSDFFIPVEQIALVFRDYDEVIQKPMDLERIKNQLESGSYENIESFKADVDLTFDNAMAYNGKWAKIHIIAKELKSKFDTAFEKTMSQLDEEFNLVSLNEEYDDLFSLNEACNLISWNEENGRAALQQPLDACSAELNQSSHSQHQSESHQDSPASLESPLVPSSCIGKVLQGQEEGSVHNHGSAQATFFVGCQHGNAELPCAEEGQGPALDEFEFDVDYWMSTDEDPHCDDPCAPNDSA